ncbi:MAG: large subunit ribosomal protein [Bacillota bacterium]|jgi:large subunit ribosomal protein L30|nr:large subunit ribosomal protein [Bacillota bacterium]MDK2785118.1 large subunit ribosomal protein [Bacillota bacterium]MDK2856721.1 large subunit ribosomal protein [Bacillota bacterium]MDK2882577.1 large subunit ribosomal protein [Bacillota bacterium]
MAKLKITLVRSTASRPADQRATVRALGLRRLHQSVVKEATPAVQGMIRKVQHLVAVEPQEE